MNRKTYGYRQTDGRIPGGMRRAVLVGGAPLTPRGPGVSVQDFPKVEPSMEEVLEATDLIYLRINGVIEWDFAKNVTSHYGEQPLHGQEILCMSDAEFSDFTVGLPGR